MSIQITCRCGVHMTLPDGFTRNTVRCTRCNTNMIVPDNPGNVGKNPGVATGDVQPAAVQTNYRVDGNIPSEVKELVDKEINPGEQIVWMGQPIASIIMMRGVLCFLIGAVGMGIGVFLFLGGYQMPVPVIPFLIGMAIFSAPIIMLQDAQNTCYVITNKRAMLITKGMLAVSRHFYAPSELVSYKREDCMGSGGAGDLVFHMVTTVTRSYSQQHGHRESKSVKKYGFIAVDRVDEVERILKDTLLSK